MKTTDKLLKTIARQLPKYSEPCFTRHLVKGHQLTDADKEKIAEIPVVDQEKYYARRLSSSVEVNHERRLRRAYDRQGKEGIIHYIKAFVKPEALPNIMNMLNTTRL